MELSERIRRVLHLDPAAEAVEFERRWHRWRELDAVATAIETALERSGLQPHAGVALLLRNDPAMLAAMLGTLLSGRCVVAVNPHQGDEALVAELQQLRASFVVATDADWARAGLRDAAAAAGSAGLRVAMHDHAEATPVEGLARSGAGPHRSVPPGTAVEMLTSGTTGPPKRVPLSYADFERTIAAAGRHHRDPGAPADPEPRLRSGVAIVSAPLVHMSGLFRTLLNVCEGRRIALLERFRVDDFVELVRRHRPRAVSLVPAALQMVLDAGPAPEDLGSLEVITSGTAPLPLALHRAFEERYGIAVLPSYGATEFAGGVAGWTLRLHRQWGARKQGSVGRAQPGRRLRVVDPDSGEELPLGAPGRLEVAMDDGPWVRTTDVAHLDEDAFLWIDGRSDDAIVRGGFKIFPDEIVEALRGHAAVRDAGATGISDARLGAVPVAAVEARDGHVPDPTELLSYLRARLPGYKVPVRVRVVDRLPRTPSMKVSQPGLRRLFEDEPPAGTAPV